MDSAQINQQEPMFYLQDSRNYVGNDMLFWAIAGSYTTNLNKAEKFTLEQAQKQHNSRHTDIPWPCAYIDSRTRPAVDMQYVKRTEIEDCGIEFVKPKRHRPDLLKCGGCGRILSVSDYYGAHCPNCGNHPGA